MQSILQCVVIDDCDIDRLSVEAEIAQNPMLKLVGSFSHGIEARHMLSLQKIDVLFIDVDMPEISGLDFIRCLEQQNVLVVIISAFPEYALEGFNLKVFDFIVKPANHERFENCVQRMQSFLTLRSKAQAYDVLFEEEKITFKVGHDTVKLHVQDVFYLEAYGDYTKIVTLNKTFLTLATLSSFLTSLSVEKFIRVHRSYVVAADKIKQVCSKRIVIGDTDIPIGKTYAKDVKKKCSLHR